MKQLSLLMQMKNEMKKLKENLQQSEGELRKERFTIKQNYQEIER